MQITPLNIEIRVPAFPKVEYSHGQELFYKFVSKITNKLVKQLLSMTVFSTSSKRFSETV